MFIKTTKSKGPLISVNVCSIDADILAHKVASACDGKYYLYDDKEYTLLADIKKDYPDGFDRGAVGTAYEPEEWEDVEASLKSMIKTIKRDVEAKEYLHFLSKGKTFRHELATIQPYKGNRDKKDRMPHWLIDAKDYIVDAHGGEYGDGVEADDMLHVGDVIASIDKDLLVVPKMHYNIDKRNLQEVSTLEADKYFYCQVLTGDTTDNILGLFGVGAKSAYCKHVKACTNVVDMHTIVYDAYKARFGSYADQFLLEMCQLVWILQDREPYYLTI